MTTVLPLCAEFELAELVGSIYFRKTNGLKPPFLCRDSITNGGFFVLEDIVVDTVRQQHELVNDRRDFHFIARAHHDVAVS